MKDKVVGDSRLDVKMRKSMMNTTLFCCISQNNVHCPVLVHTRFKFTKCAQTLLEHSMSIIRGINCLKGAIGDTATHCVLEGYRDPHSNTIIQRDMVRSKQSLLDSQKNPQEYSRRAQQKAS